jgi:hypothetical protein
MNNTITSEEPNIHWGFLNVQGRTVLDLGSSKFAATKSTPEYFIEQGATKVVGIDIGLDTEYQNPSFTMLPMYIGSKEQLQDLINEHQPEVIKADIEGAEVHFKEIASIPSVVEIAIEYHDNDLKNLIESKLSEWGFSNCDLYQLFDIETERMGVLHAKKHTSQ